MFKWQVVDSATGRVVREAPDFRKNLILTAGLDRVAGSTNYWAECMKYGVIGTDNTATTVDSGGTQAAQAGTTITLSGAADVQFSAGDVGNVIKWDTGEESTITSYTGATQVEATPSRTISASDFTLYRTNQTGLFTETKRSNGYLTGAGNCGASITQNGEYAVVQLKRTFEFATETGTVNYNEAGVSWSLTVAANLFSRFILDNAPVTVNDGEQMRIIYVLNLTIFPCSAQTRTSFSISGWGTAAGQESLQIPGVYGIDTAGNSTVISTGAAGLEPGGAAQCAVSTESTALKAFEDTTGLSGVVHGGKSMTLESYVNGTFTRRKSVTFAANEANSSAIRKLALCSTFGTVTSAYSYPNHVILLDSSQEKLNTHTLTLYWRFTWGRVL